MPASPRREYALFPGCLILQRMPGYERSAKSVLAELGVDVRPVQKPVCCGAPIAESFTPDWVFLSIYNLARVQAMGLNRVVTLCGSCTNALTRAGAALRSPAIRSRAKRRLASAGLDLPEAIEVRHLVRVLSEMEDQIRSRVETQLDVRVAVTNPCQAFRPGDVMQFDDPMEPQSMQRLVELTGARTVPYGGENECCGATLFLADPRLSLAAGRRKLNDTRAADVLVHSCGNCHLLLRHHQHRIGARDPESSAPLRRRALFLPQLVGLAMGLTPEQLGLRRGLQKGDRALVGGDARGGTR